MGCRTLKKVFETFMACFSGYCEFSQLHGFRNIARRDIKWYESLFWIVVCISGISMTAIMFGSVWNRYQLSPTTTIIETNHFPISKVPFPAITFCNLNKVLKSSFEIMAKKFEERGVERSLLERYLTDMFGTYFTESENFLHEEQIKKIMDELGYNLESFIFDLSQSCSQFLVRCYWSGKIHDCSSLFEEIKTSEGFCCTFNWRGEKMTLNGNNSIREIWKKEKYLFRNDEENLFISDANTISTGLTVILDPDEDNYFATSNSFVGSLVILHDAREFPDMGSRSSFIQTRSHAALRLKASLAESSNNLRHLHIRHRMCYFDGEFSIEWFPKYSYEACDLECKLRAYLKNCGCIPYIYPNVTESMMCDLSGMQCIIANGGKLDTGTADEEWNLLNYGHRCRCLPSCNNVNYDWAVDINEIRNTESIPRIFGKILGNNNIVSVYFEQNVCVKYRIESLITWDSVIASFGGILGLFLGGSIISLIELLYYILYDYRKFNRKKITLRTKRDKKSKIESIKVSPGIVERSHLDLQRSFCHNGFLA